MVGVGESGFELVEVGRGVVVVVVVVVVTWGGVGGGDNIGGTMSRSRTPTEKQ